MRAGELRNRVTFQRRADLSGISPPGDGYGNVEGDFADQFTHWAQIRPRFGGEEVMAARLAGKSLATITVRFSAATEQITTDWRAIDANTGEIWNIRSIIDPDKRRSVIEMLAEKGVAA